MERLQMSDRAEVDVSSLKAALARVTSERDTLQQDNGRLRGRVTQQDATLSSETTHRLIAEETAVDNAIGAAETRRDVLKSQIANLNAEGKYDEAADVQWQMSEVASELRDLRTQKSQIAGQRSALTEKKPDAAPVVDQPQVPALRKAWFDKHPEFFNDEAFNRKAMRAHLDALDAGHQVDSQAYFDFIDDNVSGAPARETRQERRETIVDDTPRREGVVIEDRHAEPGIIPADAQPEKPQGRAAGPGSAAAAIPTRYSPAVAGTVPRGQIKLTAEEANTAISLAGSLRPDLTQPADIYTWYAERRNSPFVQKRMAAG